MTPELVLNELSLTAAADRDHARQRMADLLICLARLGLLGVHGVVRINAPLDAVEIAPNYIIGCWRGDNDVDPDLRRLYKTRIGVGPYFTPEELEGMRGEDEIEILVGGSASRGCEVAYLLTGIALSIRAAPIWESPRLAVEINRLAADGSIVHSSDIIRHISAAQHIEHHRDWIVALLRDVSNGEDLWTKRRELYPHLIFAPRVRQELRKVEKQKNRFRAILDRLNVLERYFAEWNVGPFDYQKIGSKCSPETAKTLNDYEEELSKICEDGVLRLFNFHLRFTPGAGRIYFVPDLQTRKAHIGFIGEKFVY